MTGGQARRHALPAARLACTARIASGREADHDQEELQHLVVDGAGEAAEEGVDQHDGGRDAITDVVKFQPSTRCSSIASAYIEMPDEKMVITAKVMALKPRVFSSKRSFRYSGTERALLP